MSDGHFVRNTIPGKDTLAIAVIVAAWAVVWWPVLSRHEVLFVRDLALYALPAKHFLIESITNGTFPIWTPYVGGGMPFLADPANQALYPLNAVLFAAADLATGLSLMAIVHVLIGAIAMYALARVLTAPMSIALPVALLYGSSGYVVSIVDNVNYLPAVAWAPLGLAAFVRGIETGHARWTAAAAGCLALMVLAGDMLSAPAFGVACALLWRIQPPGASANTRFVTFHLIATGALATGLAAAQILPTLEMIPESVRADGLPIAERLKWSLPPWRILDFVQPFTFGTRNSDLVYAGTALYPDSEAPWADSLYLGLIPVLLALSALRWSARTATPWLLVTGIALVLACGRHAPAFEPLTSALPLLGAQRYPEKFALWVTLGLCALVVLGARAIQVRAGLPEAPLPRTFQRLLASVGVIGAGLALVIAPSRFVLTEQANLVSGYWSTRIGTELTHIGGLVVHGTAVTLALLVACWLPRRWWRHALLGGLWLAALDAAWLHTGHSPRLPVMLAQRAPPPWIRDVVLDDKDAKETRIWYDTESADDVVRVRDNPLLRDMLTVVAGSPVADSRPWFNQYASMFLGARFSPDSGILHGVQYLNAMWSPLRLRSFERVHREPFRGDGAALLARAGVRRVLTGITRHRLALDDPRFKLLAVVEAMDLRIYAVHQPLDRVRLAPRARIASEEERRSGDLDETILSDAGRILIDSVDGERPGPALDQPDRNGAQVHYTREAPGRYTIVVQSPYPEAFLVLSESWYPGWRASVDGEPARIERADHRFLAVPIPEGIHDVILEFESNRLMTGAVVSIVTLLLTILLACVPHRPWQGGCRVTDLAERSQD